MSARRIVQVFVSGRVQGVGYRDWAVATARALALAGWVRNRRDGRVEALFAGPEADVARMLESCRRGPPAARVAALDVVDLDARASDGAELPPGFDRRATV